MYKSEHCGCCSLWGKAMEKTGLKCETHVMNDQALSALKEKYSVPAGLRSCHTAVAGELVIEGHVPATTIHQAMQSGSVFTVSPPRHACRQPGNGDGRPKEALRCYRLCPGWKSERLPENRIDADNGTPASSSLMPALFRGNRIRDIPCRYKTLPGVHKENYCENDNAVKHVHQPASEQTRSADDSQSVRKVKGPCAECPSCRKRRTAASDSMIISFTSALPAARANFQPIPIII